HRAHSFSQKVRALGSDAARALVTARQARARSIREQCLKLPYLLWAAEVENAALRGGYLAASRGLPLGERSG
ncbi:MAG: hypothetical protein Q4F27_04595, partial [Desulfovibrionaceae bacterium]|nr:hypothetical protein [Desulfovibrionaceae bacterium]